MFPRIATAAFAALALAAPPAAAQTPRDSSYDAILRNPSAPGASLDYVRAALAAGDREAAISALERLLLLGENPSLRIELAQLYLDIGAPAMAEAHLDRALASPGLEPALRSRAEQLKRMAARGLSPHQFGGAIMAGLRYQTNANAGTTENLILLGGSAAVTPSGSKQENDVDAFTLGHLEHSYDFRVGNNTRIESTLDFYGSRQFDVASFSLSYADATTGIRFEPTPSLPGVSVRPHVVAGMSGLGSRIYGTWYGPGVDVSWRATDALLAYGLYQLRITSYNNVDAAPDGSLQSGDDNVFRAGLRYGFADGSLALGELIGRIVSAERSFYSYDEIGVRGRYVLPLGFGQSVTGRAWFLLLGAEVRQRWFDAPDPNVDPSTTREETELRGTVAVSIPVGLMMSGGT